jgi:hypothetical protein
VGEKRQTLSGARRHLVTAAVACVFLAALVPSCSLGQGQGIITGTLNIPNCWSGKFDLNPDFFAGVPYRDNLTLRIQNGGDFQTFSDGFSILVDDVHAIRGDNGRFGRLGEPLSVSLAPEVTPPGVPVKAVADPAGVHLALYLQKSCRTQNVAVYALDAVTLNADGTCDALNDEDIPPVCEGVTAPPGPPIDGGGPAPIDAGAPAPIDGGAAARIGHSTITFLHLFDNIPEESDADQRLNEGSFDVYLADPRDVCPGGLGPPPRCHGHITGSFKFYFERGRPGQPFP